MLKVAICEDDKEMLALCSEIIKRGWGDDDFSLYQFQNGEELLEGYDKEKFEVIFLDIILPDMDGFEVARRIQEKEKLFLIFVSSREELVFESFEFQPFYFVRKGDRARMEAELLEVIQKLRKKMSARKRIELDLGYGKTTVVKLRDVYFIQSEKNYCIYQMKEKQIKVRQTLIECEKELLSYGFCKIHKQIMINMKYASQIDWDAGKIHFNHQTLDIGRKYKNDFLKAYLKYMKGQME